MTKDEYLNHGGGNFESVMTKQSEALRLADRAIDWSGIYPLGKETAAELRRLHQSETEGWRYADELEQDRKRLAEVNAEMLVLFKEFQAAKDDTDYGFDGESWIERMDATINKAIGETE